MAVDGSKFKAVNTRDKNFTVAKVAKLAYNMKRMINIFGVKPLMQAIAG